MTRKQLIALFLCNFIYYIVGNSVMSLITVYMNTLGAEPTAAGLSLAIAFALLAVSTYASGWLSARFRRHRVFITLSAALNVPSIYMMGMAGDMQQLTLWMAVIWFLVGLGTGMINIITGLSADKDSRGRTFGIIISAAGLGQLVGGLFAGRIVESSGFPMLFAILAGLYLVLVPVSLLVTEKKLPEQPRSARTEKRPLGMAFYLVLSASILVFGASFSTDIIRPMVMEARGFGLTAITSTLAIGGLINLPLPFLIGWLSDRVGRRGTLIAGYALGAGGFVLLLTAGATWQFWAAQALISLVASTQSVGSALVSDVVEPEALNIALSRYGATRWIGAVVSFAGAGVAIENIGLSYTVILSVVLALSAIALIYATRLRPRAAYAV